MDSFNVLGQYLLSGINFFLVLTVLVAVHELGHYLVARMCGMRVDAFCVMMGGLRATDLSGRLERPLAPARFLWILALAAVLAVVIGGLEKIQALHIAGLVSLGIVLPLWVATRLGALYQFPLFQTLKFPGYTWLASLAVLFFATHFQNLTLVQLLTVLMLGSGLAILFLYYQPVLRRSEESKLGEGELEMSGERVEVRFRPVLSRKSKSGTEFSLLALPLGGFVQIHGVHPKEDGSETEVEGGFFNRSPFARFMVLLAGPAFSLAFGIVLYILLFSTIGLDKPIDRPVVGLVAADGRAAQAGIKVGDKIVSIDGKPMGTFYDVISTVRENGGKPLDVVIERDGQQLHKTATPKLDTEPSPVIGPDLEPTETLKIQGKWGAVWETKPVPLPFGDAVSEAFAMPVKMASGLFGLVKNPSRAKDEVGGVGSIAKATYEATEAGMRVVLLLAAGLSISLGFMNLLPVPPLDGGQMVVALVEMFRRGRRLSLRVQNTVSTVGMVLVVALVVSVLTLDMRRFVGKPEKPSPNVEKPSR